MLTSADVAVMADVRMLGADMVGCTLLQTMLRPPRGGGMAAGPEFTCKIIFFGLLQVAESLHSSLLRLGEAIREPPREVALLSLLIVLPLRVPLRRRVTWWGRRRAPEPLEH